MTPTPLPSPYDHHDLRPVHTKRARTTYCLIADPAPPDPEAQPDPDTLGTGPTPTPTHTLCGAPLTHLHHMSERGAIRRGLTMHPQCAAHDPGPPEPADAEGEEE